MTISSEAACSCSESCIRLSIELDENASNFFKFTSAKAAFPFLLVLFATLVAALALPFA